MAFVLRGIGRGVPSIRPTCSLVASRWQVLDDRRYYSSEGSKPSDEEQPKVTQKNKAKHDREEAKLKLNSLLESIGKRHRTAVSPSTDSGGGSGVASRLARPGARPRPREVVPNKSGAPAATATATASAQPARHPTLDEQVAAAAREVASSLPGDPVETERDLLKKLSEDQDHQSNAGQAQLSELMSSMKVDPRRASRPSRAQHVRHQVGDQRPDMLRQSRHERPPAVVRAPRPAGAAVDDVDLSSDDVLGIFSAVMPADGASEVTPSPAPSQWDRIHLRELRLSVAHPPANAWEEMVVWTELGKLWQLPVNNEQGLEHEAAVGFHEHVFLQRHLEPWCPPRGPLRQFMELVCVALGKNPWLSVQEKHEHIDWFHEYFAGKQRLLEELKSV